MNRRSGFTLIELMVAVVIGGVLFAGAIAAYRGIGEKQGLKQAGASFQANLRLFQQKALASEKPEDCATDESFLGYRVRYVDANSYWAGPECQLTRPAGKQFDLAEGVEFSAPFSSEIFFAVLKAEVEGPQTITLETNSYSYQVILEPGGVIRGGLL